MDNMTSLHCACMKGNWKHWISKKKSLKNWWLKNDFDWIAGHFGIVKFLLEKKANIEARDTWRNTPIHHSSYHGNWYSKRQKKIINQLIKLNLNGIQDT